MKRIFLFIETNIAVIAVMTVVLSLLGVNRFLTGSGLNLPMLTAAMSSIGRFRATAMASARVMR